MAYFGETVSQASLIGIALGLALGIDITAPVILVTLVVAGMLILLSRQKIVPLDAILGLMHHGALALGVIATLSLKRSRRRSHGLPLRRHLRRHLDRPLLDLRWRRCRARHHWPGFGSRCSAWPCTRSWPLPKASTATS